MLFTIELNGELTGENVEELRSVRMHVALFGGTGRHALFDHAEGAGAMEMPAIAEAGADGTGPRVVLGIVAADVFHAVASCHRNNERETIGYTTKYTMRHVHGNATRADVANEYDFTIFNVTVICESHSFRPSLSMAGEFFLMKE
jgi:hypothetical protein